MYLIDARLRPPAGVPHSTGMRGALRRCADLSDQVEHIYVEEDLTEVKAILFIRQPDLRRAESVARELCLRTLGSHPELREWTLESCRAAAVPAYRKISEGALEELDRHGIILPSQDPDSSDC